MTEKKIIEVERGEAWERVSMSAIRKGDIFRWWEGEGGAFGGFFLATEDAQEIDGVWGVRGESMVPKEAKT